MQTLFRFVVILLTIAILWKGWQLYGPSTERLKSVASRCLETAERALNGNGSLDGAALNPDDPRLTAPQNAASGPRTPNLSSAAWGTSPPTASLDTPALLPTQSTQSAAANPPAVGSIGESSADATDTISFDSASPPATEPATEAAHSQPELDATLARLEQLGVRDHQLETWGESGKLYRFSCRASWGQSTTFTRHFDSVAAEPLAAVEAVAAKVDAWRAEER